MSPLGGRLGYPEGSATGSHWDPPYWATLLIGQKSTITTNIKWQDRIPDTEVLAQADLPNIYTILMQSQLCWAGHVARMPDNRLPKRLFYGELQQGKRSHGGQKKRFKETLKHPLQLQG